MMVKTLLRCTSALTILVAAGAAQAAPLYDTIIRGGTVVDGSGAPGRRADVAIKRGHIVAVGDLAGADAANSIDAKGLVVAPGFINLHSHAEANAVATAANVLTQGITTELINSDGGGDSDIVKSLGQYGAQGLAENIGAYIGFNSVWRETVGLDDRRATEDEIKTMRGTIARNLGQGAWGVSAGLDYKPGYFADADEVVKVISVARPWRTNFPNHDRLRPEENFSSFKGMSETIAIAEQAGLVPVITHMKSQGTEQGNAPAVIDLMRRATARGTYTAADVYAYLAGQSGLAALMVPDWALAGGRQAMLERFKDPARRAEIIAAIENAMRLRFGGPSGVYVLNTGEELTKVMASLGVGPGEAVVRLLERDEMGAILRFGTESDLVAFLRYPDAAMACDCGATLRDKVHPRQYGNFPRVLGHYVRETGALRLEEAIRKMTALPATIVGMVDRGYVAPGMTADLALFDPATIKDNATYEQPTRLSEGVRYVLVNGVVALAEGRPTGMKGGAPLLRSAHMPSRPMTRAQSRNVTARARTADFDVSLNASQARGDSYARGRVRLVERKTGKAWTARSLGVIQTAPGWASLTGVLADANGELRPVTITLDHVGDKAKPASLIVALDGAPAQSGAPTGRPRITVR